MKSEVITPTEPTEISRARVDVTLLGKWGYIDQKPATLEWTANDHIVLTYKDEITPIFDCTFDEIKINSFMAVMHIYTPKKQYMIDFDPRVHGAIMLGSAAQVKVGTLGNLTGWIAARNLKDKSVVDEWRNALHAKGVRRGPLWIWYSLLIFLLIGAPIIAGIIAYITI